ncbi:hypothetical protein FXO38_01139 [Capsicum annuum]|nr:hypothetical protein FXO38_01139 [Capsicum annuum]
MTSRSRLQALETTSSRMQGKAAYDTSLWLWDALRLGKSGWHWRPYFLRSHEPDLCNLGYSYKPRRKAHYLWVDPISLADLQGLLLSHKYRLEQATVVKPGLGQANLMVKNSNKNNTFFKRNQVSNQSYDGKFDHGRGRGSRNNSPNHSQPSSNVSQ